MGSLGKNIVDYFCLSSAHISSKFRLKYYEDESKKELRKLHLLSRFMIFTPHLVLVIKLVRSTPA